VLYERTRQMKYSAPHGTLEEEDYLAELADAAYQTMLRQGLRRSFLDVELELWQRIRSAHFATSDNFIADWTLADEAVSHGLCCGTGAGDVGIHVVCARMTAEFLAFSRRRGNDLSTPVPEWGFPGLKPGDRWCLCASRWKEALKAGVAPPVHLKSTHISALEFV